jgi:hypothetical protein
MKLRCTPGCLAIVIKDTDPCRQNIGRVVVVRAPVEINRQLRLPCWLIRPVTSAPYFVEYLMKNTVRAERVFWKSRVEHPDAWLLPLPKLWSGLDEQRQATAGVSLGRDLEASLQAVSALTQAASPTWKPDGFTALGSAPVGSE